MEQQTFLTGIEIKKVRHLSNIFIPLSNKERKHLILTGKNGCGKTSTLKSLASFFDYAVSHPIKGSEELSAWISDTIGHVMSLSDFRTKYYHGLFVIAFYQDNRQVRVETYSNIEQVALRLVYSIDDEPGKKLAKYLVNLKATQAFAIQQGLQNRADEIDQWFARFQSILRRIFEDDKLELCFDIETYQFTIQQTGREPFDFNTMSSGYAAVFDIINDLIMRMENQHNYNLEGIVLIDEIETHLHLELQKKILPILTELFPNIQFIVTTHSPFILNSLDNAVIYDLEKQILVREGLTNLPYEGIVEGYFGADLLSDALRQKFERYKELAQMDSLSDDELAEADALEYYLNEIPDYLAVDLTTEFARLKLELNNKLSH